MASALYFFLNFPTANAFKLSMMVQAEADPSNLIQLGLAKKFPSFGEPDVLIPEYIVSLMGALLHHGSGQDATQFAQWLGLKTFNPACHTDNCPKFKVLKPKADEAYRLMQLADVEATIKYEFKKKALLVQAFTHQSFFHGNFKITGDQRYAASYELLEFIGDAVLDYVITAVLYQMGETSPEKIADLHKALTCNYFFASIMVKHCLPLHIRRRSHSDIDADIFGFIKHCKSATEDIHEPNNVCPLSLGFQIEEPKMLADVFEAMVGAIYLDSDFNLDTVWRVVYGLIKVEFDQYLTDISTDPITWLHSFNSRFQFSRDYFVHVGNSSTLLSVYHGIYRGATFPGDGDTEKNSRLAAARLAMQFFA